MAKRGSGPPTEPAGIAAAILEDQEILWLPIRHYSPACAAVVSRRILAERPAAVLIEAPDDATPLIPYILHAESAPPLAILSTYVDDKNRFGQNGVLSPDAQLPARFRSWSPLVAHSPEYAALVAGSTVGAELSFIDAPLPAHIPFEHAREGTPTRAPSDTAHGEQAFFRRLRTRGGYRSFGEWWEGNFESAAAIADPDRFRRAVLVFAACVRGLSGDSVHHDGSLVREAHMRWHVDAARKRHPGRLIAVVTGAYHAVVLPWTRGKKAAFKLDRYLTTLVTAYSQRALAALYDLERRPGWGHAVWEGLEAGVERPWEAAADRLLVAAAREARRTGGASTAEAVAAIGAVRALVSLRGHPEPTGYDLRDAAEMAFRKGEVGRVEVEAAVQAVLTGSARGRLCPEAGQPPLVSSWYASAKEHKLPIDGGTATVRCDVRRREPHRRKSEFLHQCRFLEIPMFGEEPFRGPDPATGEDLHLLGETWQIRWREEVVERLVELADRGPSVAVAAESVLDEKLVAASGDAEACAGLVVEAARMRLVRALPRVIAAAEDAASTDTSFERLVGALGRYTEWYAVRDALPTHGADRLRVLVGRLLTRATLAIPDLSGISGDDAIDAVDRLRALLRHLLSLEAEGVVRPDRELLTEKLRALAEDPQSPPMIVGGAHGALFGLGATDEALIARTLEGLAFGAEDRAGDAGSYLDGLLRTSRAVLLGGSRLLDAVDKVITRLSWDRFVAILPDLRRAFTWFVPAELDRLAERIAGEGPPMPPGSPPEDVLAILRAADQRAESRAAATP
jgi:hypothetical protein